MSKARTNRTLQKELSELRSAGVTLPRNPHRAMESARQMQQLARDRGSLARDVQAIDVLDRWSSTMRDGESPEVATIRRNNQALMSAMGGQRRISSMRRTGNTQDVAIAIPRFYDPLEYWDLSGLPWNMADEGHRHKLHKWLRLYYATHHLIPILIDIFTRFPLVGMHMYCLQGDTKVITDGGTFRIRDLVDSSNGANRVLNKDGRWVDAEFKSFGEQSLVRIVVERNRVEKEIWATPEHRWFVETTVRSSEVRARSGPGPRREVQTQDLQIGDILASTYAINQVKRGSGIKPSAIGVAHGIVFGDGTKSSSGGSYVDLHGPKNTALLSYFPEPNVRECNKGADTPCCNLEGCLRVSDLPGAFKELPSLEESASYLYGWLAGYFAADGTVSERGECVLYSASHKNLEFAQTICHRLGIDTTAIHRTNAGRVSSLWRLPIHISSLTPEFFKIEEHLRRYEDNKNVQRTGEWKVVSVEETDLIEEVYCAIVPDTASFVLDDNILTGNCKDQKLTEFYEQLFLNDLKYEDFLVNLGREYWTVGEAFPLGSFNEDLGVWEREELLNPEDIIVENYPLMGTRQLKVVPPEYLKRLATTKSPPDQYKQLELNFPDLIPYLKRGEPFPVSEVLLKQVAFKITDWDDHGTPLLLRGLRTLLHEEKLLASQDAIAERLYSPLILAKLGINNVGDDEGPWIPGPDQLEAFRDDMDMALASDFRLMVYHYALEVENVFGREQVPDLWNDFDRINNWLLQIFGLQNIMGTGSGANPYASTALNAEFMNQILRTFQGYMKDHAKSRMEVVAEAQEHWDYEKRGQTRVPIFEDVVVYDEEGNIHIERRHKLLVPDLDMEVLDMRDEATERQFLQSLRSMGVPISDERMMIGLNFEFIDSLDEMQEEMIQKTVAQQMAKLQTYKILRAQGLSIPPDLKAEIEGGGAPGAPGGAPGGGGGAPGAGGPPGPLGVGAPTPGGGTVMPPPPPGLLGPNGIGGGVPGGGPPAAGPNPSTGGGTVPPISNERRPGMPRPARLLLKTAGLTEEEIDQFDSMSDEDIDQTIHEGKQQIEAIEWRKRMRMTPFERRLARTYETEDMSKLAVDTSEKIVIDRVPPRVRKTIAGRTTDGE